MFIKGRRLTHVDNQPELKHAGNPAFGVSGGRRDQSEADQDIPERLTFGTGVTGSFLRRVLEEPNVEILRSHQVVELLQGEAGDVIGARAVGPDGPVDRLGPVVLATSSYDWDPELVQEMLGLSPEDFGSAAPQSIRGDGITLARSVGGAVARIPATSVPMLPGWSQQSGTGYGYGPEYAMPHAIIVDRTGRRYCDDSHWVDIVAKTLTSSREHLPFFLIWDDRHRERYGLGETPPGGEYPEGWVTSAPTLEELGNSLQIDGDQLARTVDRFNSFAVEGSDPDFGRGSVEFVRQLAGDPQHTPSPVLGTIEQAPFHGMRLKFVGTGIGSSGVHIDSDGHVLDAEGSTVSGLFAVGSCAALTTVGTGYNSGFALGRGITLAYLVACELGDGLGPAPLELV